MANNDLFPTELRATVEENKNIQAVYIEESKGQKPVYNKTTKEYDLVECNHWHFNHATTIQPKDDKGKPIGAPYLAVNGKKVTKFTREEILQG